MRDGVVDSCCDGEAVGGTEFVGGGRGAVGPSADGEHAGIESREELDFVAPMFGASPEADARFVPSAREDSVFAFWAEDAEELGWEVGVVGGADGNNNVTGADVGILVE